MSWTENVNVPMVYENGRYKIKAAPYVRTPARTKDEWREMIVRYLRTHPGVTQTTICRRIGVRWQTINPILNELVENGFIRKEYSNSHLRGEGSKYYLINHI